MTSNMEKFLLKKLDSIKKNIYQRLNRRYTEIFNRFQDYTMIGRDTFVNNLTLVEQFKDVKGAVVECGTWRGGMIAGIASLLGNNRKYYLFDSFEGLPDAREIDGEAAKQWQANTTSVGYYDNCKAEMSYAKKAMSVSGASDVHIIKGWFSETLPSYNQQEAIAILRLDGDWYDSTMDCLDNLYDAVVPGGVIILDDYHTWDGCTRAVHDFLSKRILSDKIRQWHDDSICFFIKEGVYKD